MFCSSARAKCEVSEKEVALIPQRSSSIVCASPRSLARFSWQPLLPLHVVPADANSQELILDSDSSVVAVASNKGKKGKRQALFRVTAGSSGGSSEPVSSTWCVKCIFVFVRGRGGGGVSVW